MSALDAGFIKVNFPALNQAADDLKAAAQKIDARLNDLETQIQSMNWQGDARAEYDAAKAVWDKSARDLIQMCEGLGVAVKTANDDFLEGEKRNAARF